MKGWPVVALHPDGKTFAVVKSGKLFIGPADETRQREYRHEPFPSSANPLRAVRAQFSPDGSKLAVALEGTTGLPGDLWILPWLSGGTPRRMQGTVRDAGWISWFPDSRRVLLGGTDLVTYSLIELDTATGRERAIWSSPGGLSVASVAPDGKRIALTAGEAENELAEVSLPDGRVSTLLSRGSLQFPEWSPSGTHYLYEAMSPAAIEDRSAAEGFVRVVVSHDSEGIPGNATSFGEPRWAPDGLRFVFRIGFGGGSTRQLWVSNVSVGHPFRLSGEEAATAPCWSPDGEWIAYIRLHGNGAQLVKTRASSGANPVVLTDAAVFINSQTHWSPAGDWILYPGVEGLSIISPDGRTSRTLIPRPLVYGFSKRGDQVIGVFREVSADGVAWPLISIDVKTGAGKRLATLSLPEAVSSMACFSLHPDGKRFATQISRSHYDLYMLEGFDEPKSWLDRLLRR